MAPNIPHCVPKLKTVNQGLRNRAPCFSETESGQALEELRDRWRYVSRAIETDELVSVEQSVGLAMEVSRTVRPSYGLQRSGIHMWNEPRLYATFADDPRELDDIAIDSSDNATHVLRPGPPRVSVVIPYDPLLRTSRPTGERAWA